VLQHQRGDSDRALTLLRRAAQAAPQAAGIANNLANVLLRLNRVDEAEQAFKRSIGLSESGEAWANLSRVLRRRRQWPEAEAACRRALEIAPGFGDAWHNLSLVLFAADRIAEGVEAAARAMVLLPPHKRHRDSYTRALVLAGELEQAAVLLKEWLVDEPDNPYVLHHLAACSGEGTPERASDAYVEHVFDEFAATFDSKLAGLQYRAPELVTDALRALLPAPAQQFDIADLGCGTGLCGPLVKGWARHLVGCDLSAQMLDRARDRAVYDELLKVELVQFMAAREGAFDVVLSADTLIYFGDLQGVLGTARRALRPGGVLVFTLEALDGAESAGHRLLAHGRYAHSLGYVQRAIDAAGLTPAMTTAVKLREEGGRPVLGWLVTTGRAG
jgi:predicted TPR repeat methyltransferase